MKELDKNLLAAISSVVDPLDENVLDTERAHAQMHQDLTDYHHHVLISHCLRNVGEYRQADAHMMKAANSSDRAIKISKNHGIVSHEFHAMSDRIKDNVHMQARDPNAVHDSTMKKFAGYAN